ncbi:hypothetical protein GC209_14465 [bacterium]|nr:hypothetical protein [bacterium]
MFKQATGLRYVQFMDGLHRDNLFDWYLEVGCRKGRTFAPVRGKTIAVDPYFLIETNVIKTKPQLHIFQETSDDFFESGFLAAMKIKLSFSFLDGMHLFEFLLRDFMAAEKASHPDGVIALHDCCPFNHEMTTRDLDNIPKGGWTGDVWKLLPILRKYRPDLVVTVLDAAPTGMVLVSNLDPKSKVLRSKYDKIMKTFRDVTLQDFGVEEFNACFDYTDARAFVADGYPLFKKVTLDASAAITPKKITP